MGMGALLDLRRRVRSVKNTQQITRAMKLVSAAKLRRAQDAMLASRPYADKMWEVLGELSAHSTRRDHPLMDISRREDRITAVILTSDRGLCGSFNSNVINYSRRALKVWDDQAVQLVCVGRKGHDHFKRRSWPIARADSDLLSDLSYPRAAELAQYLMAEFTDDRTDAVYLIYNEFVSVLRQRLVVEPLLPLRRLPFEEVEGASFREVARAYGVARTGGEVPEGFGAIGTVAMELGEATDEAEAFEARQAQEGGPVELVDFIYEPDADTLVGEILPRFVEAQVYQSLLESNAAEHAARMAAMDNATKNAEELIEDLTLTMNKIRQEAITTEILEVVAGADAL